MIGFWDENTIFNCCKRKREGDDSTYPGLSEAEIPPGSGQKTDKGGIGVKQ